MSKFIYVFTPEAYEDLTRHGYELLKEDKTNGIWIFVNKDPAGLEFADVDYQVVLSNVVSF